MLCYDVWAGKNNYRGRYYLAKTSQTPDFDANQAQNRVFERIIRIIPPLSNFSFLAF